MNDYKKNVNRHPGAFYVIISVCTIILICSLTNAIYAQELARASTLPDLSGMAWIENDLFLGIHDAKRNPEKYNWPRVSLVRLPKSELQGVTWQSLNLKFPGSQ